MSSTTNGRKPKTNTKSAPPSPEPEERTDGSSNQGNPPRLDGHLEPSAISENDGIDEETSTQTSAQPSTHDNPQNPDLPSVEELLRQSKVNGNGRNGRTVADGSVDNADGDSPKSNSANGSKNSRASKSPSNDVTGEGAIAKKASDTLASKTSQQAQELIKADKRSKQQRLETGIREGIEDAKDIRKGYQLGLLYGLTKSKERDSQELDEQLQKLRQHTDASMGDELQQALDKVLGNVETEDGEDEEDSSNSLDLGKLFENNSDEETLNLFC